MIVFHGGFTLEQVNKLKNNEYVLYPKSEYKDFRINISNTFKYSTLEKYKKKREIYDNIIEENYNNQWVHCFKYLTNALDFCFADDLIVAFDIDEQVLDKYVGVGYYKCEGYKIEYRIPRNEVNSSIITDVIEFRPFSGEFVKKLYEKYPNNFRSTDEHFEAAKVLKKTKKKLNYL